MKFLKGFFKTVAVLFLIFGVGRYVLDSISMYNTLSTEQTYIENTFTDLHKADVETKVLFDEFADNLAYRKWANYFLTVKPPILGPVLKLVFNVQFEDMVNAVA